MSGSAFSTTCRTCAAPIIMTPTDRGWRPCDPQRTVGYSSPRLPAVLVTDDGTVASLLVEQGPARPVGGRPLHRCRDRA
jgi:hypothetical protein